MLALPQMPAQSLLVPLPCLRNKLCHESLPAVPLSRKHACVTALAADLTPEALAEVCVPVQQAIADMQAAQLLVLCWCMLASQLIVYAFDKRDEEP